MEVGRDVSLYRDRLADYRIDFERTHGWRWVHVQIRHVDRLQPAEQNRTASGGFDVCARNIKASAVGAEVVDDQDVFVSKIEGALVGRPVVVPRIPVQMQGVELNSGRFSELLSPLALDRRVVPIN